MSGLTQSPTLPEVLTIVESFKRPDYRVADMEVAGFTHLKSECPNCGWIVEMPFQLLRKRSQIGDDTTLEQITRAFRCAKCSARRDTLLQPSYRLMGTSNDTASSPVNRRLPSSRWYQPKKP